MCTPRVGPWPTLAVIPATSGYPYISGGGLVDSSDTIPGEADGPASEVEGDASTGSVCRPVSTVWAERVTITIGRVVEISAGITVW